MFIPFDWEWKIFVRMYGRYAIWEESVNTRSGRRQNYGDKTATHSTQKVVNTHGRGTNITITTTTTTTITCTRAPEHIYVQYNYTEYGSWRGRTELWAKLNKLWKNIISFAILYTWLYMGRDNRYTYKQHTYYVIYLDVCVYKIYKYIKTFHKRLTTSVSWCVYAYRIILLDFLLLYVNSFPSLSLFCFVFLFFFFFN